MANEIMIDDLDIAVLQSPGNLAGPTARLSWLEAQLQSDSVSTASLLLLPELFQCGYGIDNEVRQFAEPTDGFFAQQIARLCRRFEVAITYGFAEVATTETETTGDTVFNAAQCIDSNGHTIGHHRKLLLPPGYEESQFTQGQGCSLFMLNGFSVSLLICYDIEFPENARRVAAAGAELILVPTALTNQWGVVSEKLIPTRAFENGVFVAYANHCGTENSMNYFGGSCIVAPDGDELARAGKNMQVLRAQLRKSHVSEAQQRLPYLVERKHLDAF